MIFKRIAQKILPNNPHKHTGRVRIEYGSLLSQDDCEAILFFMHPNLQWGGGVNRAVLDLAGPELDEYVLAHITTPRSGEVFALPPFESGYKALFVAVLANWDGGNGFEERDLLDCYRLTVQKAQEMGIRVLGIPAMGRDKRDFPHIRFARVALKGILQRLDERMDYVKIMCVDHTMMATYQAQMDKIERRSA
jgi:O-acetyl-ADP-ribose deacetylase (regulator of RNase III)